MLLVTSEVMRYAESTAMTAYKADEELLMEIVATRFTDKIIEILGNTREKMFLVFAGKGKNGGDAIAIARHLILEGAKVSVFLIKDKDEEFSPITQLQIDRLREVCPSSIKDSIPEGIKGDFLIDGLFGTGFKGELREPYSSVVSYMNTLDIPIISIDVPSGLDASTGKISNNCVKATYTFTLGLPKLGLFVYPGAEFAGEIHIINLGFPLERFVKVEYELIDENLIKLILPSREPDSHKGTYGRVGIIAGSSNYPGASILVTKGALASGAGLVTLFVTPDMYQMLHSIDPEVILYPRENWTDLLPDLSSLILGPGIGKRDASYIGNILSMSKVPVVLDADGLNSIVGSVDILKSSNAPTIITPHPGEMARLIGKETTFVQNNRLEVAVNFSREYGVVTVLKGARTIVSSPEGITYINPTGNPSMATGGMGDVLSGLIGGFVARGLSPLYASILGVYIHGLAGDKLGKRQERVLAQEVASEIPILLRSMMDN
ncbi:MAG: NAD(P)H-hydrate dehydratase [bacterium]|nr:NAD(P)H-hydrate dehydratase [bacterium]